MPLKHITTFQLFGLKVIDIYWRAARSEIFNIYQARMKKTVVLAAEEIIVCFTSAKYSYFSLANSQASFVKLILSPIGHCLSSFAFGKNS